MNNSNGTLKPQTKIRRTHGEVIMREHLPIALEEIRDLATCGLPTCGQCETTLRIVESMQKFVRGVSDSLAASSIDSSGMTLLELAERAEAVAVLSAAEQVQRKILEAQTVAVMSERRRP